MGQPAGSDSGTSPSEGQTRGTETSHYPEEKKITMIAQVVASERAGAQTRAVTAAPGVVGPHNDVSRQDRRSYWKVTPQRVTAP